MKGFCATRVALGALLGALLGSLLLGFSSCANPFADAGSPGSPATASLNVSLGAGKASRSVAVSSARLLSAVAAYKVSITGGGLAYSVQQVGNGSCTVADIVPGSYTLAVAAYADAGYTTQIASGSASVSIVAGGFADATVNLSFTQTGTGGLSLLIRWPTSAKLPYFSWGLDEGSLITLSGQAIYSGFYDVTFSRSGLASGAHILKFYFKESADAPTSYGPFIETVNIWDGATSTQWIDPSGAESSFLLLGSSDFADDNADLAAIKIVNTDTSAVKSLDPSFSTSTAIYNVKLFSAGAYTATATASSAGATVSMLFNGSSIAVSATSSTSFAGSFSYVSGGDNELRIIVTAADGRTTKVYRFTSSTLLTSANFSSALNGNLGGSFLLTEDVTIADSASMIGSYDSAGTNSPFTGTFDGNGHTITANIDESIPYCGVFRYNQGIIKNLHVDANIIASSNDIIGSLCAINAGSIYRCYSTGSITAVGNFVGGLVGENYGGIQQCYSTVAVTSSNTGVGGLVGIFNSGLIVDSYARGSVVGRKDVGGLCAVYNDSRGGYGPDAAQVYRCYSSGSVSAYDASPENIQGFFAKDAASACTVTAYDCLFAKDGTVNSSLSDSYASGTSPAGMKQLSTYPAAWSISSSADASYVWGIDPAINDGYPYLQCFGAATARP